MVNSDTIISALENFGLKFAIMIEDRFSRNINDTSLNVDYIRRNYFTKSNYVRDENGKPLLLTFGPITFKTEQEWVLILANAGEPVNFLTLWYDSQKAGSQVS